MSSTATHRQRPSDLLWLAVGLSLGALIWFGYQQWQPAASRGADDPAPVLVHGTWLPQAKSLPPFALLDHHGAAFTPQTLVGHWTFMFFGYTHCPDVCPTTMGVLGSMATQLAARGISAPRVVFVSVDPQRDTVAQLSQFVPYFNPDFVGVTGDEAGIDTLTRALGIVHARSGPAADDAAGYLMDHSAALLLFNPDGHYNALFSAPHGAAQLADDYARILKHHEVD